jgi:hypothetical protein
MTPGIARRAAAMSALAALLAALLVVTIRPWAGEAGADEGRGAGAPGEDPAPRRPSEGPGAAGPGDAAGAGAGGGGGAAAAGDPPSWALDRIGARLAWRTSEGSPEVVIAVLDTGVSAPPGGALEGALLPGRDLVERDDDASDPDGHGTAVATLAAGRRSPAHAGVAPRARILPVRVADAAGRAPAARLAEGIRLAAERGARVICVALGTPLRDPALDAAVAAAEKSGALVVAAAGSEGTNHVLHPAACPGALAVGASDDHERLSADASFGPRIDLFAPGERCLAVGRDGRLVPLSGSSAAAAIAAGAAALVRAAAPDLPPAAVRAVLSSSAPPLPIEGYAERFHAGRLDLPAALALARAPAPRLEVLRARLAPRAPRPGQSVALLASVRNGGALASPEGVLRAALEGAPAAAVEATIPALSPGEVRSVSLTLVAPAAPAAPGAARVLIEARLGSAAPGRALALPLEVSPAGRADLALESIEVAPVTAGARKVEVRAVVRNRGTEPARGVPLEVRVEGPRGFASAAGAIGDLAPGAASEVVLAPSLPPLGGAAEAVLTLGPVPGEPEEARGDDRAYFRFRRAPADGAASLQYVQLPGPFNVVADAPFRLEPGRPWVPVLFFVPWVDPRFARRVAFDEATLEQTDDPARAAPSGAPPASEAPAGATAAVSAPAVPPGGAGGPWRLALRDGPERPPENPSGATIVDEDGREVRELLPGPFATAAAQGIVSTWHRVVRLPAGALAAAPGRHLYLRARVAYALLDWRLMLFETRREGAYERVLRVRVASEPLPRFPGGGRRYFDGHVHTIAEWASAWPGPQGALAPLKAWGGPIRMLLDSSYAIGLIDDPADARDKVVHTDHNCFFNHEDADAFRREGPRKGPSGDPAGRGDGEHAAYASLFGRTSGEEVTLALEQRIEGAAGLLFSSSVFSMGRHLLTYDAPHIPGPWHGGIDLATLPIIPDALAAKLAPKAADVTRPFFVAGNRVVAREPNPNTPERVLGVLRDAPGARSPFAYAAHPLASTFPWGDEALDRALGLSPRAPSGEFARRAPDGRGGDFAFKGFQVWNGRFARKMPPDASLAGSLARALDDTVGARFGYFDPALSDPYARPLFGIWFGRLDPWSGTSRSARFERRPNWDGDIATTWLAYLARVQKGLDFSLEEPGGAAGAGAPGGGDGRRIRMIRKVFGIAGTDAHGDFNSCDDIIAQLLPAVITHIATASIDDAGDAFDAYADLGEMQRRILADLAGVLGSTLSQWIESETLAGHYDSAYGRVRTYAESGALGFERGQSVMTDGPIVRFAIDADSRLDSETLAFRDRDREFHDADGRVGGDGAGVFDGGRTALVAVRDGVLAGGGTTILRYVTRNTSEFDTEPDDVLRIVRLGGLSIPDAKERYAARRLLVRDLKAAEGEWNLGEDRELAPGRHPLAYVMEAFTHDPPSVERGPEGEPAFRCYTNPVYVVPVEVRAEARIPDPGHLTQETIPAGAIEVEARFGVSMRGPPSEGERGARVLIRQLDARGESYEDDPERTVELQLVDDPAGPAPSRRGWSDEGGFSNRVLRARNAAPVRVDPAAFYPSKGTLSFAVIVEGARDAFGTTLNAVATTMRVRVEVPDPCTEAPGIPAKGSYVAFSLTGHARAANEAGKTFGGEWTVVTNEGIPRGKQRRVTGQLGLGFDGRTLSVDVSAHVPREGDPKRLELLLHLVGYAGPVEGFFPPPGFKLTEKVAFPGLLGAGGVLPPRLMVGGRDLASFEVEGPRGAGPPRWTGALVLHELTEQAIAGNFRARHRFQVAIPEMGAAIDRDIEARGCFRVVRADLSEGDFTREQLERITGIAGDPQKTLEGMGLGGVIEDAKSGKQKDDPAEIAKRLTEGDTLGKVLGGAIEMQRRLGDLEKAERERKERFRERVYGPERRRPVVIVP